MGLVPQSQIQLNLLHTARPYSRDKALMSSVDTINTNGEATQFDMPHVVLSSPGRCVGLCSQIGLQPTGMKY